MPPAVGGSSWGCPAVWSISHHRRYCYASLRYDCVSPVAHVAWPRSLAGGPPPGCVPARLSSVASMAPSYVCHGPRCSLAGLGPVALEYGSCHWPGGSAGSPQCVRPWGCRPLRPVPLPPSVCVRVRCPGPLGACSLVRTPFCVSCAVSAATWLLFTGACAMCGVSVLMVALSCLLPAFFFVCSIFVLFKWKRGRVRTAGTGTGN